WRMACGVDTGAVFKHPVHCFGCGQCARPILPPCVQLRRAALTNVDRCIKPAKPKDVPMADQQKPRIADDARVLEIYGNKVVSTSFDGGAVVITIGTGRFLPERIDDALQQGQQPVIHVTARLALSPSAAVELGNALNNILRAMTTRAATPPGAPPQKPS